MKYFTDSIPETDWATMPQFSNEAAESILASVAAGSTLQKEQVNVYLDNPEWQASVLERARAAVIRAHADSN